MANTVLLTRYLEAKMEINKGTVSPSNLDMFMTFQKSTYVTFDLEIQ